MELLDKFFKSFGYVKQGKDRLSQMFESAINRMAYAGEDANVELFSEWETAYGNEGWVYACVYTIANAIAGVPYKFFTYKKTREGIEKVEVDGGNLETLFENPNPDDSNQTWYNLIEYTLASLELTGNAYWLKDKEVNGVPTRLTPIQSSKMRVVPGTDAYIGSYEFIKSDSTKQPYTIEEISHFKYMSVVSMLYGQAAFQPAIYPINLLKESLKTNYSIFKNGARLDGVLETEQTLNKDVIERLKAQFLSKYQGSEKAHQLAVLEAGLKYKSMIAGMKELEYIEGTKLNREEVCAIFKVPPVLVGILDKATYNNYDVAERIFWKQTLIPKIQRITPIIDAIVKLYNPNIYFEFDLSKIEALKDDQKLLSDIAKAYFSIGIPLNQIILQLGLPFKNVDGGDVGYIPFSLMPIGSTRVENMSEGEQAREEGKSKSIIRSKLTAEMKAMLWKAFDRQSRAIELRYHKVIDAFFSNQEKEVLANVDREGKSFEQYANTLEQKDGTSTIPIAFAKAIDDFLFDEKEETIKWKDKSIKVHTFTMKTRGESELEKLGLSMAFNMRDPKIVKFLNAYALDKSKEVNTNLKDDLKKTLIQGVNEGEGIPQLKNRIRDAYKPFKDSGYKAERIARTEVIATSNKGAVESYRQSEVVKKKTWLSQPGARTFGESNYNHAISESVDLDKPFTATGETLDYPGDPKGSAGNIINCRCSLAPEV